MKNDDSLRRHLGKPTRGDFLVWVPAGLAGLAILITTVLAFL